MNNPGSSTSSKRPPPAASTYQQQAYDFVKAQIINMDLKPGQYVTDSQIAESMAISRTPVREALRRLEQEGLLVSQARRGWKVYSLSLEDVHELFDIKVAIDGLLVRKAAECRDEHLREVLAAALENMKRATDADDLDAWQKADTQLHETIYTMAGNERAARIVRNINDQWYRLRVGFLALQGRMQQSLPEHEEIVTGILSGQGEEAERLHTIHTNRVRRDLVRVLVNLVLPFVQDGV